MRRLTVMYDPACGFCVRCRYWMAQQPCLVDMEFLPRDAADIARRFPGLEKLDLDDELVVVDESGGVYWGEAAYLICLWALEGYREWAFRLSTPTLLPFARYAFGLIAKNRLGISSWLGWDAERRLQTRLQRERQHACPTCE